MNPPPSASEPPSPASPPGASHVFGFQRILPPAALEPERTVTVPFEAAVAAHHAERRKGLRLVRLLSLAVMMSLLIGGGYGLAATGWLDHILHPQIAAPSQPPLEPSERERILSENMMLKHELVRAEEYVRVLESQIVAQDRASAAELAEQAAAHEATLAALRAQNAAAREAAEAATAALLAVQQSTPEEARTNAAGGGLPAGWEILNQRGLPHMW